MWHVKGAKSSEAWINFWAIFQRHGGEKLRILSEISKKVKFFKIPSTDIFKTANVCYSPNQYKISNILQISNSNFHLEIWNFKILLFIVEKNLSKNSLNFPKKWLQSKSGTSTPHRMKASNIQNVLSIEIIKVTHFLLDKWFQPFDNENSFGLVQ